MARKHPYNTMMGVGELESSYRKERLALRDNAASAKHPVGLGMTGCALGKAAYTGRILSMVRSPLTFAVAMVA